MDSECVITAHVTCRLASGVRRQFFLSLPTFGLRAEYPDLIPVAIAQSPSITACAMAMRID
jgi:hypothetical protein